MSAVTNTSPVNFLVLIGLIDLLPELFDHVIAPVAVAEELAASAAPEDVRDWIAAPPHWFSIEPVQRLDPTLALDRGELEAISLAFEVAPEIILIDERPATIAARRRGLKSTGTIGVLQRAARLGLIDLVEAVDRLRQTTFRATPAIWRDAVQLPPAGDSGNSP